MYFFENKERILSTPFKFHKTKKFKMYSFQCFSAKNRLVESECKICQKKKKKKKQKKKKKKKKKKKQGLTWVIR